MTAEEEVVTLRQEKSRLQEQMYDLQEQVNQDSHNSHLPPSSDRFHRQPKSLAVIEHQAQAKYCPRCQQISSAPFPPDVCRPVQNGTAVGVVDVYLVRASVVAL